MSSAELKRNNKDHKEDRLVAVKDYSRLRQGQRKVCGLGEERKRERENKVSAIINFIYFYVEMKKMTAKTDRALASMPFLLSSHRCKHAK